MALRLTSNWLLCLVFLDITFLLNEGALGFPNRNSYGSSFSFGRSPDPFSFGRSSNPFDFGRSPDPFSFGRNRNPFDFGRSRDPFSLEQIRSPYLPSFEVSKENLYSSSEHKPFFNSLESHIMSGLGSSSGNPVSGPTESDLSYGELKKLLSAPVISQQIVTRPKGPGIFDHEGVLITTADGKPFLIHKGANYGLEKGGNTVITDASHMSNKWKKEGPVKYNDNMVRVTDLIKLGGRDYNLLLDNCKHAVNRMMDEG